MNDGPALFSKIPFVHHSYGKRKAEESTIRMEKMKTYRVCPSGSSALTEKHIRQFFISLESKTNAPLFTIVMRNNYCKPLPPSEIETATTAATSAISTAAMTDCDEFCISNITYCRGNDVGKTKITSEQAAQIERNTRGRANSTIWYQESKTRVTASFFGRVCRRLPNTSSHALVNSVINQKIYRSIPIACAWGKSNENIALNAYKSKLQEYGHFNLKVTKSGLVINPNYVFLGASPDSVVFDPVSSDLNGLLEIKCSYHLRDCTPQEIAQQKAFFCSIENGTLILKEQHHYYYQVQGQMVICSRK